MSIPAKKDYLSDLCDTLARRWPENRTVNIVCHGHSVPAGYACTPWVDTFDAYPHLLHRVIKQKFPFAVVNVIVTAVGGENALSGAKRFERDVLCHRPDLVTIDYSLNDRGIGLQEAQRAWRDMIEAALKGGVRVILMTPSWDLSYLDRGDAWQALVRHAEQVRSLAEEYEVGLADSFAVYERHIAAGGELQDLLSHVNHPSPLGHQLIARELARWFFAR